MGVTPEGTVTLGLDPRAQEPLHQGMKGGTVYILASGRNGTLYVGVTSDLPGRMALIEKTNPEWRDLYPEMLAEFGFASPGG